MVITKGEGGSGKQQGRGKGARKGNVLVGTESRKKDGGQHTCHHSSWWVTMSPRRRYPFRCCPLLSVSIVVCCPLLSIVRCCPSSIVVHPSLLSIVRPCPSCVVTWCCVAGLAFGDG